MIVPSLEKGGVQNTIANYIRNASDRFRFDIIVCNKQLGSLEHELEEQGCRIWHIIPKKWNLIAFSKQIEKIIKNNEKYDIVHSNIYYSTGIVMWLAYKNNVPLRIAHIHSRRRISDNNILRKYKIAFLRIMIKKYANRWIACSELAGIECYGKKFFDKNGIILPNRIELGKFFYDEKKRIDIRKELGLETNQILIGQVANLVSVKNQILLIDLFKKYLKKYDENAKLLIVGEGIERKKIEEHINKNNLFGNVILAGTQECVEDYLSSMDVFVLTSLHEGFGISILEALANGLPCVLHRSVLVGELQPVFRGVLTKTFLVDEWCDAVYNAILMGRKISNNSEKYKKFDLQNINHDLVVLYD